MGDLSSVERRYACSTRSRELAGPAGKASVKDLDLQAGSDGKGAPTGSGGPEARKAIVWNAGGDRYGGIGSVIAESAQREHTSPRSHGASVMVSAFGLVPRIAVQPVIAAANVFDAGETLVDHAVVDHQRRRLVLEAGHHFGVVRERDRWPLGHAIVANNDGGFVVQRKGALDAIVLREIGLVVVAEDGIQRLAHIRFVHQRPQATHLRLILPDQLVYQAARADLVFRLFAVVRAHIGNQGLCDPVLLQAAHMLNVELAVEQIRVNPLGSLL